MDKECKAYLKSFGERARELRLKKNWSQKSLSDASGLHISVISDIEKGKKEVSFQNRRILYKGLGVTEFDFHDTPELRAFTGAPAAKHQKLCPFAKCGMRCFEAEEEGI